jgi:hypothetical protein
MSEMAWFRQLRYDFRMAAERYTSKTLSSTRCQGERFGTDGFPQLCDGTPVWDLAHSNGRTLHICEYHIEFYWNAWPPFRDAVRDIWPVKRPVYNR